MSPEERGIPENGRQHTVSEGCTKKKKGGGKDFLAPT